MMRGLNQAAEALGITPEPETVKKSPPQHTTSPDEVPMMYQAQVDGRCSLMFAGSNRELEKWKDEWIHPDPERHQDSAHYQRQQPALGLDGNIYRIEVKFPFRLLSNCGQDSIIRPILGKDGIPFLSGSSVKGLFRRACVNPDQTPNLEQIKKYCGDNNNLAPSGLGFRFHGAYPVGDWSGMHPVRLTKQGRDTTEIRYQMLDVIHPQQDRQIGSDKQQKATALASVSLHQPTMIFEFSSAHPDAINWQEVEAIFWRAIALGVGGKTSTGYGLSGYNDLHPPHVPNSKANVMLIGSGVSSTLRSNEPEFRPNLFKASLRGHFQRLLAGVVGNDIEVNNEVNRLFGGSSSGPGAIQLFWEPRKNLEDGTFGATYDTFGATQTFRANGMLHLNAGKDEDVELIERVLKFAFIMGGFGKSWRRASHQLFHQSYKKFEIGCHWELPRTEQSWMEIKSKEQLTVFLTDMHQDYIRQFGNGRAVPLNWRESWHPDRLTVYAAPTRQSKAIELFHDGIYKYTPAIGGRIIVEQFNRKTRREEEKERLVVSHVWHRMLPVGDENFLEIVTLFHSQRDAWKHKTEGDQLQNFIASLQQAGLSYAWGNRDPQPPIQKIKKVLPNPKR